MTLTIIAAKAKNNVIGVNNNLPWHFSKDLQFFKNKTLNGKIVMGRRTFESLGCKPLKDRQNIVLSRCNDFKHQDVTTVNLIEVIQMAQSDEEIFVIGGSQVYEQLLPWCTRMYITDIDLDVENGDSFFPTFNPDEWSRKVTDEIEEKGIRLTFLEYNKIK